MATRPSGRNTARSEPYFGAPTPTPVLAAVEHYGVDPLELLRIAYLDGDTPRTLRHNGFESKR
jgi:hypothetical protein